MEIARKWGWCTISFESCLSVQQSSGVQGRLESSVQYVNYFYIAIILFWLEMRWYVNGNQL